ncbi:helix-turn-helix domain-containing protein [Bacillus sp. THAF10]|uniref:AraC family transcriptional regulator n=1 Tax=Bacillus sp. THAF10 TaxID=2587848 RepID=UPI00126886DD|nr:helix-turn-helix domain-containing protein [Bacillus sp. THAF10]
MIKPTAALSPWVECYWQVQFESGLNVKEETILPNGKVEMIFALQGNYQVVNRKTKHVKEAWLSGLQLEPLHIEYSGTSNLVGIRFKPYGLFPFLTIPICETANFVEPCSDIFGSVYQQLYDVLLQLNHESYIGQSIDHFLLNLINEMKTKQYKLMKEISSQLQKNSNQAISDLALNLGYTERHLTRLCRDQFGVSPKMIARIFRFERALSNLFGCPDAPNVNRAIELGFYDQSHFLKEFKRFSGMTPEVYKQKAKNASNFL